MDVIDVTRPVFGTEEMLFRGVMLNALRSTSMRAGSPRLAWAVTVTITGVLFGVAHSYQDVAGMVLTGAVGVGYGAVYLLSRRNLWAAVLTHGIYDTIGFTLVYLNLDGVLTPSVIAPGVEPWRWT
jgi:membrane protease YdiL (CAAX protease family)